MLSRRGAGGPSRPRRAEWLLGLAGWVLVAAACSAPPAAPGASQPGGPAAAPPDPGARGPYAVGATRRSLTRASTVSGLPRTLDTVVWYPAASAAGALPAAEGLGAPLDAQPERAAGPYPVLLLSPGAGDRPESATYFTTHLASHGFVVVGVSHPGTTPAPCPYSPCRGSNPEAQAWYAESNGNRLDDAQATLAAVLEWAAGGDPLMAGMLDAGRLAMGGVSMGGATTVVTVADDPRLRAAVLIVPSARLGALEAMPRIAVPTMIFSGALDDVALPAQQWALYEAVPEGGPEHWLLTLLRGGHGMAIDSCPADYAGCNADQAPRTQEHARINRWATVFLRYHVAGDARYAPLLDPALAASDPDLSIAVVRGAAP
jgi:dienelactone hydrolase